MGEKKSGNQLSESLPGFAEAPYLIPGKVHIVLQLLHVHADRLHQTDYTCING